MPEHHAYLGVKPTRKTLKARNAIGVCPQKGLVAYGSRSAAKRAVKSITSQGKGNTEGSHGRELHEYLCKTCGNWHVGH